MAEFHYGSTIPGTWPRTDIALATLPPSVSAPPSVSYLSSKPNPWKTTTGRQVFLDDMPLQGNLAGQTNVTRVWIEGTPHASNPVLRPTEAFEALPGGFSAGTIVAPAGLAAPFSDGIWPDPAGNGRIWAFYFTGGLRYLAVAYSDDWGLTWSGKQTVVDHGAHVPGEVAQRDSASIVYNPQAAPSARWEYWHTRKINASTHVMSVRTAPHPTGTWSAVLGSSVAAVVDRSTVGWDPFRQRHFLSHRQVNTNAGMESQRIRRLVISSNADPATFCGEIVNSGQVWDQGHWSKPDGNPPNPALYDPRNNSYFANELPQIYHRDLIPYPTDSPSGWVVWDTIFYGEDTNNRPKRNQVTGGWSRNVGEGQRVYDWKPFGVLSSTPGAWNWGNMQSTGGPLILAGDLMYGFVSGRNGQVSDQSGDIQTGRYQWVKDRLCVLRATGGEAVVTLIPQQFETDRTGRVKLTVNAKISSGSMTVELQDSGGTPIPGFTRAQCNPITGDKTRHEVSWSSGFDVERLARTTVILKAWWPDGQDFAAFEWEGTGTRSHGLNSGVGRRQLR